MSAVFLGLSERTSGKGGMPKEGDTCFDTSLRTLGGRLWRTCKNTKVRRACVLSIIRVRLAETSKFDPNQMHIILRGAVSIESVLSERTDVRIWPTHHRSSPPFCFPAEQLDTLVMSVFRVQQSFK